MASNLSFKLKISKAKIEIMTKSAFFSSIMLSLPMVESEEVPTLTTNGEQILYNKHFLETLDSKYISSAIMHEVVHAALEHCMRRGNRDPEVWNIAADYWDNYLLNQMHFPVHPAWLRNDSLAADKSVELIYKWLMEQEKQEQEQTKQSAANAPLSNDVQEPGEGEDGASSEEHAKEVADKMQRIVARAAREAKAAKEFGNLPAELQRMINDTIAPKLSWKELLRNFITERIHEGTTWTKRNRRYTDFYLPAHETLGVSNLLIAVDTSGSINNKQLAEFMAEVNVIRQDVKPRVTTVVSCDTTLHNPQTFDAYEDVVYVPKGGGGTAFTPVYEYAKKMTDPPKAIIYFTDGYGCFGDEPDFPLMWVMYSEITAPFGQTVRFT